MKASERFAGRTISIQELIDMAKSMKELYGEDTPVVMSADYGDHCHTTQALEISSIEEGKISETGYSNSGFKVNQYEDEDEFSEKVENPMTFLVIQ